MLIIILTALFIIPVLFGWGILMGKILRFPVAKPSFFLCFLGIFGVTIFSTVSAFFFPISYIAEIFIVLIGIALLFLNRKNLRPVFFPKQDILYFGIIILVISFAASFYPYILDHFGYYIPTIQWITEFGLVKGIANLDLTLGQTSLWHTFQAVFSHFSDYSLRINAVLLIIFTAYILEKKSFIQLIFIPVFLLFVQSPTPDLPAVIFTLVSISELFFGKTTSFASILALSVFAVGIKPTVFWLPLFVLVQQIMLSKIALKSLFPATILLILILFKNLYLFGYPFFPLSFFDFNFPWKTSPEILQISSEFGMKKTFDEQFSATEIRNFTFLESLKQWLLLRGIKGMMNILLLLFLTGFLLLSILKKNKKHLLLSFCLIVKTIVIIWISAQFRFFLEVYFVILLLFFHQKFSKKTTQIISVAFSSLIILYLSLPKLISTYIPSYKMSSFMGAFQGSQIIVPSEYTYLHYHTFTVGNLTFHVSKNYPFSFDAPLPAISEGYLFDYQKTGIFPQWKNVQNKKEGFVSVKMNATQEKQLQKITGILTESAKY